MKCVTWQMCHCLGKLPRLTLCRAWKLSKSFSRVPQFPLPAPPLTLLLRHDAAPSFSHHNLRCVFSLASLSDAPSSLPTFWGTMPPYFLKVRLFLLFSFLFSLAADLFSFLSRYMGPPLAGKREGGLSPSFHVRSPSFSTNVKHAPVSSFVFSFSFHSLTTAPPCPPLRHAPPPRYASRLRHALPRLSRRAFATRRRACRVTPSPHVAHSSRAAPSPRIVPVASRRVFATRCAFVTPRHVATLCSNLWWKWRRA